MLHIGLLNSVWRYLGDILWQNCIHSSPKEGLHWTQAGLNTTRRPSPIQTTTHTGNIYFCLHARHDTQKMYCSNLAFFCQHFGNSLPRKNEPRAKTRDKPVALSEAYEAMFFGLPPIFLTLGRVRRKVRNQLSARADIMFTVVHNPAFSIRSSRLLAALF